MTQKEFEERTGLSLTIEGYREVEECYMNTDLDKDSFCKLWVENPTVLKEIERKTVLVRELYEERKSLSNFLIEQAEKWSVIKELCGKYQIVEVLGHRDTSPDLDGDGIVEPEEWTKMCPCFDVRAEYPFIQEIIVKP